MNPDTNAEGEARPLVVVGLSGGKVDVVVGPYTYLEHASTAFVEHAKKQGAEGVTYHVVGVTHPLIWHRANQN